MQFTLRQLLLFVAAVAVILGLWQYLGPVPLIILAIALGMLCYCVRRSVLNWKSASVLQKLYGVLATVASVGIVLFAVRQFIVYGAVDRQTCVRNARELGRALETDSRYAAVEVSYWEKKGSGLSIEGTVDSQNDLEALRQIVRKYEWPNMHGISWHLTVGEATEPFDEWEDVRP